jgi:hypothetical protein
MVETLHWLVAGLFHPALLQYHFAIVPDHFINHSAEGLFFFVVIPKSAVIVNFRLFLDISIGQWEPVDTRPALLSLFQRVSMARAIPSPFNLGRGTVAAG